MGKTAEIVVRCECGEEVTMETTWEDGLKKTICEGQCKCGWKFNLLRMR